MYSEEDARTVDAVRRFTRFYTREVGVLEETLLGSELSLAEGRVVYELATSDKTMAGELAKALGLDPGYLSRLLKGLVESGLIERRTSNVDARKSVISLTDRGLEAFSAINARSRREVGAMIASLTTSDRARLTEALRTVEALLGNAERSVSPLVLRNHEAGDLGWVVHRHGVVYAREYGWDESFEALVAEVCAQFLRNHDPRRERCWIAEREGENVGSVFCVRQSDEVAQLRLLLVEPAARGAGLGRRLVEQCIRFARNTGYRTLTLWTNDVLAAARRIYEQAGFVLVAEEPHNSFGHDLVGQTWNLEL